MKQLNNLIEFRQAIYEHGLTKAKDAQVELVDALLLSSPIRSFTELSLSPAFRRKWSSAYAAIENGERDREWLERLFVEQIPVERANRFSPWTVRLDLIRRWGRWLIANMSTAAARLWLGIPTLYWPGCLSLRRVGHHPCRSAESAVSRRTPRWAWLRSSDCVNCGVKRCFNRYI